MKKRIKNKKRTENFSGYFERGKVSVLMLTHTYTKHLFEAIDCFLSQTYDNKELILLDSGSTTHYEYVAERLRRMGKRTVGIRHIYVSNTDFNTVGDLRNFGLKLCSGEYVCIYDDDDLMSENRIERQLKHLKENGDGYSVLGSYSIASDSSYNVSFVGNDEDGLLGTIMFKNDVRIGRVILFGESNCCEYDDFIRKLEFIGYERDLLKIKNKDFFIMRTTSLNLQKADFFDKINKKISNSIVQNEKTKKNLKKMLSDCENNLSLQ